MTAIDDLAVRVLRGCGLQLEPPIDVHLLAKRLGVLEITEARLVEDGRLERADGQTKILIRRGVSTGRRRFTIAHELGHLLLAEDTDNLIARRARLGIGREERFCDEFAAALLLPHDWLRRRYTQRPRRLAVVRELAASAKSSLAAAVIRLDEVVGWRRSLLRWRADQGRWRLVSAAAVPSSLHGEIGTAAETRHHLDRIAHGRSTDVRLALPLLIRGAPSRVESEVSVTDRTAIALAAFPTGRDGLADPGSVR
jgi:hypothetical protein